jgi:hypothetical protein
MTTQQNLIEETILELLFVEVLQTAVKNTLDKEKTINENSNSQ